jgi:hypothetical protein
MKQRKSPEIINIPEEKLSEIKTRLESGSILEEDKKVILLILSTYAWLYRQLQTKKLGIQRLRNLFGFSTENRAYITMLVNKGFFKQDREETNPVAEENPSLRPPNG